MQALDGTFAACSRRAARGHELELVIPALNEEARLGPTLRSLVSQLASLACDARILVVDNGSADATAEVADSLRGDVEVEVVGCGLRGKGAAVRAGVAETSARFIGYCDADLSTPPEALGTALRLLEAGGDVVVGSRRCDGATYVKRQAWTRRLGGTAFRIATRRLIGSVTDTQCGFKLFRGEVGRSLFHDTASAGFAFDVEVLLLAVSRGYSIAELPVAWSDHEGSTFRPLADGLAVARELWAMAAARRQIGLGATP